MEQEESMKQASIQFRCRKLASAGAAVKLNDSCHPAAAAATATPFMNSDGDQDSRDILQSPTPDKPESWRKIKGSSFSLVKGKKLFDHSHIEGVNVQSETTGPETTNNIDSSEMGHSMLISSPEYNLFELPEEYKTLSVLFERMNSSIRLLALRKRLPTFRNISTQVEILSKRKFLCSHLAQMKYAFPEAIQIEKILIHDERSLCMIPEMTVTLVYDVMGCPLNPDQSASTALCNAFRARLLDFLKTHPEGTDIPQAALPEPFNPGNQVIPKMFSTALSKEPLQGTYADLVLSGASHFSSSFHQQFSQKIIPETQKIETPAFPAFLSSTSTDEGTELRNSPKKEPIPSSASSVKSPAGVIYTPRRMVPPEITSATCFITKTPSLLTPKICLPTSHEKFVSEDDYLVTEPKPTSSVRKSLIFSVSEDDESLSDSVACTSAQDSVHPYACRKTKSIFGDEIIGSFTNQAGINEDHKTSQEEQEKRHNSLCSLLGMFDTICLILRSTDCSFITKQELVHKIILNNLDIEETREVEEQLQLLEELVPDWISKKAISNGDCFYCIKQAYDQGSVRARLVEPV